MQHVEWESFKARRRSQNIYENNTDNLEKEASLLEPLIDIQKHLWLK